MDAQAALDSACHVLNTLQASPEMRALLGVFVDAVAAYGTWLQVSSPADAQAFAQQWNVETQWGLLDIVQMHSSARDEALADVFVRNLEEASGA